VNCPTGAGVDLRPAGDRWSPAGLGPPTRGRQPLVAELPATSGRGPVAARRPSPARWSPAVRRPEVVVFQLTAQGWLATSGCPPATGRRLDLWGSSHFSWIFFSSCPDFLCKWSTLAGWLQHMLALPRLLLETSNTHNFWSVGPKNTIFFPREVYCETHVHKKFQKIQK
jgi:hypothetical protein